ncbi:MAG: sugar ABC transporter ATP-binding protein, partial [Phycisphaerae bacterium]|nr:sugar ABC transporter ATP-binding protein [Phycisphaerae bacterium]
MSGPVTIFADHIAKDFGSTRALDDVSVRFNGGEVHGVVGENGAGKSTLMKILSGVEQPSDGRIVLDDQPVRFRDVVEAARAGVVMIHQELNLVEELSVAENIFLGREQSRGALIDRRAMEERTGQIMRRLATTIEPRTRVGDLRLAQRQMVEIGKALARDARIIIMDEPTAVLTRNEIAALFRVIQQLRGDGVAVIYISHLLAEVLKICDSITVLRDGKNVANLEGRAARTATEPQLAGLMVGRVMGQHYPPRAAKIGQTVLNVTGLSVDRYVRDVSFNVRAGEILGFAGLIGAGRTEVAEAIVGLRRRDQGMIQIDRLIVDPKSPRQAVSAGIAYVPEDRKNSGLMLEMSIA